MDGEPARALERVLYWTDGHPFMTQQVCEELLRDPGSTRVSRLAAGALLLLEHALQHRAHHEPLRLLVQVVQVDHGDPPAAIALARARGVRGLHPGHDEVPQPRAGRVQPAQERHDRVALRAAGPVRVGAVAVLAHELGREVVDQVGEVAHHRALAGVALGAGGGLPGHAGEVEAHPVLRGDHHHRPLPPAQGVGVPQQLRAHALLDERHLAAVAVLGEAEPAQPAADELPGRPAERPHLVLSPAAHRGDDLGVLPNINKQIQERDVGERPRPIHAERPPVGRDGALGLALAVLAREAGVGQV